MNKINTVIFDIGNVMVEFCWRDAISNMNLPKDQADRLAKATILSEMWNEFDRGILTYEELVDGFVANDPEIEEVIIRFLEDYYNQIIHPFDYADEWIDSLKEKGYKVYFLSNFSERGFKEFEKELSFVKKGDGAVISYREQLIKPDEGIYKLLLERYNINPGEAVFIDDTRVNIEVARSLGINGIVFETREQVLRDLKALGVD